MARKIDGRTKEGKAFYNTNPEQLRKRIQTGRVLDRVQKCAKGEIEMSNIEMQAAKLLLDKAMPSMQAVQQEISETKSFVVETPKPVKDDTGWEESARVAVKALEKARTGNGD